MLYNISLLKTNTPIYLLKKTNYHNNIYIDLKLKIMSEIKVNSVKNSNIAKLKFELNKRGLSTHGKKCALSKRLIGVIEENSSQEDNGNSVNTRLSKKRP